MAEDAAPHPAAPDPVVPALTRESTGQSVSGRTSSNANGNASVTFQLSSGRRQSSSARINEILENARERAETMASGATSPKPPRAPGSPIFPPRTNSAVNPIIEDSSADEATGFIAHTPPLNYNSVTTTTTTTNNAAVTSGARVRKTSTRSTRRSRPASQHQSSDAHPPAAPGMTYSRQSEPEDKDPSWWQVQAEKFQSIELENKGSVARDHLAIERTFLAWLRTSLSFASIGIAVTQLFRLNTSLDGGGGGIDAAKNMDTLRQMGKPLGTTFLGISILTLFLGYRRYFQSQHWVMQGKFPASRGTVTIVAFVAFAIMVASLVVVIAIHPSQREL
ncbi:hypothetical protein NW755_000568 [Fusarium falciforme]|uniref:DUF202 domain-containing protein n=1 Tax=Fusarium falciforme TaxID=195108 RepID=A0A9W8RHW6_9HYPO|nr:hypothetical protein NW755_000568 [Fusarium falciforme]KAJ4262276.1 hypothetical protein NW757_000537 [Fusarium falciforme]